MMTPVEPKIGDLRIIEIMDNKSWLLEDYHVEKYVRVFMPGAVYQRSTYESDWRKITSKTVSLETAKAIVDNGGIVRVVPY